MKQKRIIYCTCIIPCILFCCKQTEEAIAHETEIINWKYERIRSLTAADGWTTLCGLYWLQEGYNPTGSGPSNSIQFPRAMPAELGSFYLSNDSVHFKINDVLIKRGNNQLNTGDSILMFPTTDEMILSWNAYQWFIIKRGDRYGIRLRDTLHPNRNLTEIPSYPISQTFNIPATISYRDTQEILKIENVLGQVQDRKIVGTLEFNFEGTDYSLSALDGGPEKFYIIFSDETTGYGTYGGGRFLYPDRPSNGNKTFVDFNKAYNPPCVFSIYATCPLPPKENHLAFEVEAGEKYLDLGLDH